MANKKSFKDYEIDETIQYYGKWQVKEKIRVKNCNLLLTKNAEGKERVIRVRMYGKLNFVKSTFMKETSPADWYQVKTEREHHRISW